MTNYEIMMMIDKLSQRARILTMDMDARLDRIPDVADFRSAFNDELQKLFNRKEEPKTTYGSLVGQ